MVVAGPLVVGKAPDGARGGGCRVLTATHGFILELVRLAALGHQLDCGPRPLASYMLHITVISVTHECLVV